MTHDISDLKKDEWYVILYCDQDAKINHVAGFLSKTAFEGIMVVGFCKNCTTYKARVPEGATGVNEFERIE